VPPTVPPSGLTGSWCIRVPPGRSWTTPRSGWDRRGWASRGPARTRASP